MGETQSRQYPDGNAPGTVLRAMPDDRMSPGQHGEFSAGAFAGIEKAHGVDQEDDFPDEAAPDGAAPGDVGETGAHRRPMGAEPMDGEDEFVEGEEAPAERQPSRSLFSRLIIPVGVTFFSAVSAASIYELGFFNSFFSSHKQESILDAPPGAAQQPVAHLTPMPKLPGFAKGSGSADRVTPSMGLSTEVAARTPASQGKQPIQTDSAGQTSTVASAYPNDGARPDDGENVSLREIAAAVQKLQQLTAALKVGSDARTASMNKDFSLLAQGISQRFDTTDGKIAAVDGQINLVTQQETANTDKISTIQGDLKNLEDQQKALIDENNELKERLEKLESELHDTVSIPVQRQVRPAPPAGKINRHLSANETPKQQADTASNGAAPQASAASTSDAQQGASGDHVLEGYFLRGIARGDKPNAAWIKTPKGFFMANVGQSLEGAGVVKEIRRYGDTWEVVTSQGLIRP
jgi:hypothetical protein